MAFGLWYTSIFFVITTIHWVLFKLVMEKPGTTYRNIIDQGSIGTDEFKDTIVSYYRTDPDIMSLHEQFGYKIARDYPYGHILGAIVFMIWLSTIPIFIIAIIWFYWFEKPRMIDPLARARMELAKERKNQ